MTHQLSELTLSTGQELWTVSKICEHVGIEKLTWSGYVTRGTAPAPAYQVERTRLWDAEEVKTWHAQRPGSPVPNSPGK